MTRKQRMLAAIRGETLDRLPWAPRLDLWYRANRRAGTLPPKYRVASLIEMVDDLGFGHHAVVPDFRDLRGPEDDAGRALGIYNLKGMPYRSVLENVEQRIETMGDRTTVTYRTPFGSLRTVTLYDENMRRAGVTITHVEEYAFKDERDYRSLAHLFRNLRVEPNHEGYREFSETVGERGIAVGFVSLAGSPMHLVQRELMPFELFFFELHDHPDQMTELAAAVSDYWQRVLAVVGASRCEVLLVGANYDATVTSPPFFHAHIEPWLRRYADALHASGKFLMTHTDGENTGLLPHYLEAGFDIADSVCPSPMTRLSFKAVRDVFGGRIAIMGGIPSVSLLPSSMSDRDFAAFLDRFFDEIGDGRYLVLGVSDTTPPQADFQRLLEIAKRADRFPVKPSQPGE
jgi:hypothetical protein